MKGGSTPTHYLLKSFTLIVTFFFSHLSFSLYAQTLNLNQFGIEEGLPQSSIYTMQQDKYGTIWVGTMSGVSKYNGLSFENYSKKDGLAENRVTSSCIDKEGNIWFGHWSGGISKYNINTAQFEEITPKNINSNKSIFSILQDKNGIIWFATEGQGLIKLENGNFSSITTSNGLTSNTVYTLEEDRNGVLWIGTTNGITQLKQEKYSRTLINKSVRSLLADSKGNMWVGTTDAGIYKIGTDNQIKNYTTSNGLAHNYVRVMFEDASGNIFIGTYGGGVSKYLPQLELNNYNGSIFQTISTKHGLSNDKVLSIIQDREKNIWIGTYLYLNQYFDEQFEIYGNNEGLSNSLVWSILQDRNKNFWIGTEGGLTKATPLLNKNLPANKHSPVLNFQFEKVEGRTGEVLNTASLFEDVKGNIWYSNFGRGISRYNPSTKHIDNYTSEKNGLPTNEIYSICGDKNGNVWIGTNKGGLLIFDIRTEKFSHFTTENGIGSDQIYTIFKDSKDRMWLGSLSGGVTIYDNAAAPVAGASNNFKVLSEKEGYPSKFTLCVTEDANGNIWLGTYDLGIYKYDGKSFKNYSTREGLSSNTPFLLITDNNNNLWIGTGLGIDRFNIKEETFKHYEKADGFLGVEINPNAVCKDQTGCLWFGSIIGLVKYNAKNEKNNLVEPITIINNPRIFFQEEEIPADHRFGWNKNHLTFDFVGTSLTNPKRVKYRYQLEGLDKEKSPIVKETSVTYPALDPGDYTFKVWSCNNDGVWMKEPATFQFKIAPPFWKTTWFWILVSAILLVTAMVYVKWRERKLRKENQILEQKVTERTETIRKQNIELEHKNQKITDSIDYAKRIQDALFISEQEMKQYPFEWFLLFRPKDIVSGDFYWSYKLGNKVWIAVADCTGHGVPGAFMSLIGYNLLNRVIKEMGLFKPSDILNQLRKLMKETFSAANNNIAVVKDGMTISLVCIDIHEKYVEYAGSYNNLYLFRNRQLTEYKSNRIAIGNSAADTGTVEFNNQNFTIQKGDSLFLFSDGYPDQLGGPERKKFYYPPFKELLGSIHTLPVQEQRQKLNDALEKWMHGGEQIDDISILGIKF